MEEAREKATGKIVDAWGLKFLEKVDESGYECHGCDIPLIPCSYGPENLVRPYFKHKREKRHEVWCDVDGQEELGKIARKKRVTTRDGYPGSFPNRLKLADSHHVAGELVGLPTKFSSECERASSNSINVDRVKKTRPWTATAIRRICHTFLDNPYDRDLPLFTDYTTGKTYREVFKSLYVNKDQRIRKLGQHIFYAPLSWKTLDNDNESYLEVILTYGEWENNKLVRPYRVIIDWDKWSNGRRRAVSSEFEIARKEYQELHDAGHNKKAWVFFIGRQDEDDPAIFHVDDHRLICCLVAEMIYPKQ